MIENHGLEATTKSRCGWYNSRLSYCENTLDTSRFLVDFNPVFLDLGALKIHWYGITYLIAFACYWLLGRYRIRRYDTGWTDEQLSDFLFYGALGVIIGGRLGWYLFYNDVSLTEDPLLPF